MTVFEKYQQWLNYAGLDEASRAELLAIDRKSVV